MSVLKAAEGRPVLVELKDGSTLNGILVLVDDRTNIKIKDAVLTSRDGDSFQQVPLCTIRGHAIKYFCVPEDIPDSLCPPSSVPAPVPVQAPATSSTSSSSSSLKSQDQSVPKKDDYITDTHRAIASMLGSNIPIKVIPAKGRKGRR